MKITVVYGGRGLIDDPTLYVLDKIQTVLEELRVTVDRINLYEQKNVISTMPAGLKDADGVILGVSLEWFGIGGYMQEFLDACWLYGDKEKLQSLYMMPVVISTTNGEKAAELALEEAWEILGGTPIRGVCAYVENHVDFEMNKSYGKYIEKCAEDMYRVVNQRREMLPSSIGVVRNTVLKGQGLELTPQESEQLSKIVSDDTYVKQQKEDIEELTSMFKGMLNEEAEQNKLVNQSSTPASPQNDNYETFMSNRQMPMAERDNSSVQQPKKENYGTQDTEELISSLRNIAHNISASQKNDSSTNAMTTLNHRDYQEAFGSHFHPEAGFNAIYSMHLQDKKQILCVQVQGEQLDISYSNKENGDVKLQLDSSVLSRIVSGELTFQKAFMGGDMKVKGNFKTLRMLDQIFVF